MSNKRSEIEQEIHNKEAELINIDNILHKVNKITEVYQNVPLCIIKNPLTRSVHIESIETDDEACGRDAHICKNASEKNKFILYLIYYDENRYKHDICCGRQFENENEVLEIAKRWVALRELPVDWSIEKDRLVRQDLFSAVI